MFFDQGFPNVVICCQRAGGAGRMHASMVLNSSSAGARFVRARVSSATRGHPMSPEVRHGGRGQKRARQRWPRHEPKPIGGAVDSSTNERRASPVLCVAHLLDLTLDDSLFFGFVDFHSKQTLTVERRVSEFPELQFEKRQWRRRRPERRRRAKKQQVSRF